MLIGIPKTPGICQKWYYSLIMTLMKVIVCMFTNWNSPNKNGHSVTK